jgi:hypothetical protein
MEGCIIHVAHCRYGRLRNDCFNDNIVSVSKDLSIEIVKLCKLLDFIKQVVGSDLCEWFMLKWIQLHKM